MQNFRPSFSADLFAVKLRISSQCMGGKKITPAAYFSKIAKMNSFLYIKKEFMRLKLLYLRRVSVLFCSRKRHGV